LSTTKRLVLSTSPHLRTTEEVPTIMYRVVFALLPAMGASVYFFGLRALLLIFVCAITGLLTEHICQKLRNRPTTIRDGSALVTSILLALILPPAFPLWAAALGTVVAIGMGKMVFGGLGYNIFNPALVGRAFLQAAFPVQLTTWSLPEQALTTFKVTVTTQATPLAAMKFQHQFTEYSKLLWGTVSGSLGETSAIAILIGGIYLLYKRYADWRIVSGVFAGTIFLGGLFWLINPERFPDPLFQLLSGGFMLGAFFMATDMVTAPGTTKGRAVFGFGVGLLIVVIRAFSGLPEGVMYAILLMNALAPMIERYTQSRVYGTGVVQEEGVE